MTDGISETNPPSDTRHDVEDGDSGPAVLFPRADSPESDDSKSYMDLYSEYLKRQLIVYTNWPQYKLTRAGYSNEKVFRDQNS